MGTIQFKVSFETNLKRKVQKFLELYSSQTAFELNALKIEGDGENRFQTSFFTESDKQTNPERIYELLILANQLSDGISGTWTIHGPHDLNDLIFEMHFNGENDDQPLKRAHLELT